MKLEQMVEKLVAPEVRRAPGKLARSDLERLVRERRDLHEDFVETAEELLEVAPILSQQGLQRELKTTIQQAEKLGQWNEMLEAALAKYSDLEVSEVGLARDWLKLAGRVYEELGKMLQVVMRQALPLPEPSRVEVWVMGTELKQGDVDPQTNDSSLW